MSDANKSHSKQLFHILVAAAWIDGEMQSQEQKYLQKIAKEQNLLEEQEIQDLLSSDRPISSAKCYQLLENYLGDNPTSENYQDLLSAISSLVYVDDNIATEEAKLLTQLQELGANNTTSNSVFNKLLSHIQKLYKKGLASV